MKTFKNVLMILTVLTSGSAFANVSAAKEVNRFVTAVSESGMMVQSVDDKAGFEFAAPGENSITVYYPVTVTEEPKPGAKTKPYGAIGISVGKPLLSLDAALYSKFIVIEVTGSVGMLVKHDQWVLDPKILNSNGDTKRTGSGAVGYAARLRLMQGYLEVGVRGQEQLLNRNTNPAYKDQFKPLGYDIRLNLYNYEGEAGDPGHHVFIAVSGLRANSNFPSEVRLGLRLDVK